MPCILHVDDDPADRELVKEVIRCAESGLFIIEAGDGRKALDYLCSDLGMMNPPRLILLDINMPVLDGRETLGIIRREPLTSAIPVVIFTTSHSDSDRQFCEKLGAELITKPATFRETQSVLKRILEKHVALVMG